MLTTTDKIEIPQKIIDKLRNNDLLIENFNIKNIPKEEPINHLNNNLTIENKNLSLWGKIKFTIKDYFNFFNNYLKSKIKLIENLYILRPIIYLSLMIIFKKNLLYLY